MKRLYITLTLLISLIIQTACSTTPSPPVKSSFSTQTDKHAYLKEYISWLITKEMKGNKITGLSIALVDNQQLVWAKGFGYADKHNKIAAQPNTIYRAGSISKLLTSTAAMQLVESGDLALDAPLTDYLPSFNILQREPHNIPITPRMLMTHHSGLPGDRLQGMFTNNPDPFTSVVDTLKTEYQAYPPLTLLSYSNVALSLLGHAIEKSSGLSYVNYMESNLFTLMNMNNSNFNHDINNTKGTLGYKRGSEKQDLPPRDLPAASLNTTVEDLSRFLKMIFADGSYAENKILSPSSLNEMFRHQNADIELDFDKEIGLSWFRWPRPIKNGGLMVSHGGATMFHRATIKAMPESKIGVVILSNSASASDSLNRIANQSLRILLRNINRSPVANPTLKSDNLSPKEVKQLISETVAGENIEGYYSSTLGFVKITKKDDIFFATVADRQFKLKQRNDGLLALEYKLLGLFDISLGFLSKIGFYAHKGEGHDLILGYANGRRFLVGQKIQPSHIPLSWRHRIGHYEVVNGGRGATFVKGVEILIKEGFLLVKFILDDEVMFQPIKVLSDSRAVRLGLGRYMGEMIYIVREDGIEFIEYSGLRFARIEDVELEEF